MANLSHRALTIVIIGMIFIVTVNSQLSCYSCSESTTSSFSSQCLVTSNETIQRVCASNDSVCRTYFTYGTFTGSFSVTINRGCTNQLALDCNNCTNPRDCSLCCGTELCNNGSYDALAEQFRISQPCYSCSYSEIPGANSNEGCGPDFDDDLAGVSMVQCPGFCAKATTTVNGLVNEIDRYCAPYASGCDSNAPRARSRGTGSLLFETTCCNGPLCNNAIRSLASSGIFVSGLILSLLVMLIFGV